MGLRQLSETVKEPVLWSQDFPGFSYAWSWATFAGLAQLPAISGGHTNLISDPHMVWTQHTDIFGTSTSTSTTVNGSQKVEMQNMYPEFFHNKIITSLIDDGE